MTWWPFSFRYVSFAPPTNPPSPMFYCNTSLPSRILIVLAALTLATEFSLIGPHVARAGPTSTAATPVVKTPKQGSFKGLYNQSSQVEAFLGIPFAEPPLGELRFQKTQAVKPYDKDDVRDATKGNRACMQSFEPLMDDSTAEDVSVLKKVDASQEVRVD